MTKYTNTFFSVSTVCFSAATFVSACGGATPQNGYKPTNWENTKHQYKVSYDKGGYDYHKHGDQKVQTASWQSHDDWSQNNDWSSNDNWSDDGWSDTMSTMVGDWGNWAPMTWEQAGHNYNDWHDGVMSYADNFSWKGGSDNWTPSYGAGWQSDWNTWNPKSWKDAGSSWQNWHDQWMAHLSECQNDWSSQDNSGSDDQSWSDSQDTSRGDDSSWKDNSANDSSWSKHNDDTKQTDWSQNEDDNGNCDHTSSHDSNDSNDWQGKVHDSSGGELTYTVHND